MQAIFFKDFNYLFWEGGAEKEGERESFFFFLRSIYLLEMGREREHAREKEHKWGARGRGRSRLPTEQGAQR